MADPEDPLHLAMMQQMQALEEFKRATQIAEQGALPEIPPLVSPVVRQDFSPPVFGGVPRPPQDTNRLAQAVPRVGANLPPGAYMPGGGMGRQNQRGQVRPNVPMSQGDSSPSASSSTIPGGSAPPLLSGSVEHEKSEKEKFINFVQQQSQLKDRKQAQLEQAKKDEAEQAEIQQQRCHLHKKPNQKCKFCKRFQEFVDKKSEEKYAAAKEQHALNNAANQNGYNFPDELEMANPKTFGFPALYQMHIVDSVHFKTLATLETFDQVVDEIVQFAESIEPYMPNSVIVPTPLFACLYRLFTMGLSQSSLVRLLDAENSPYVRCAGLLFVRFGLPAEQLWPWLEEYVLDEEELKPTKESEFVTTVGEFVEGLLSQDRYYSIVLPRLPVSAKRQLEAKLAQVPQFRKRAQANQRLLDVYRQSNVKVQVCNTDGTWVDAVSLYLNESRPNRLSLHVRLEDNSEASVQLGKVILADSHFSSANGYYRPRKPRSRSRSLGQVDWSRDKGKSGTELVDELRRLDREKAVCSSGKEYAKKPLGFKASCALAREMGVASQRLLEDETFVPVRAPRRELPDALPEAPAKKVRHSAEYQAQMQQLFEKYGMAKGAEAASHSRDVDGPDVLRFG